MKGSKLLMEDLTTGVKSTSEQHQLTHSQSNPLAWARVWGEIHYFFYVLRPLGSGIISPIMYVYIYIYAYIYIYISNL